MPRAIVERWNSEIVKVLAVPEIRQRIKDSSMALNYTPSDQTPALIRSAVEVYERLLQSTGIELDD